MSLLSKISVNDTIVKSFNIVFHHFNVHSVKTVSGTDDLLMVPNSNFLFFFFVFVRLAQLFSILAQSFAILHRQ